MKTSKWWVVVGILTCAILVFGAVGWATDYYVRTDGNDSNDGSENNADHAWLTIQHAVDTVSSSDTINVADGTYTITAAITVDKGVTITGNTSNPANVVVKYSPASNSLNGFEIGAANITIQGFKIIDCKRGVYFDRDDTASTGCTITNCVFDNNSENAIGEVAAEDTTISNNAVTNCGGIGIEIRLNQATSPANRTKVTGNTLSSCNESCIQTYGGKYVYIFNNTITSTSDKGINIIGSDAASIAERIEVIDNDISGTVQNAILLTNHLTCYPWYTYIHGNTINNVSDNGIVVANVEATSLEQRVEVSNNTISNTGYHGIEVGYISPFTYVHNNIISGSSKCGISIANTNAADAGAGVEVSDNTISNCYYQGINIDWSSPHTYVYNNTITKCNYYGADGTGDWDYASIHVGEHGTGCHHTVIDNNTISDGINGVQIWSDNCTVTNNTIYDMGLTYATTKDTGDGTYYNSGIIVGSNWNNNNIKPAGTTITGNNIHDNHWGLYVRDYATLSSGDPTALNVTAEENYWGAADGPGGAGPGSGDDVSVTVDYSPWWGANYVGDLHTTAWTWGTDDSIQEAIDAASAGDTINVLDGTYAAVVINKDLTLQAGSSPVIEGEVNGVTISDGTVTITGFTIRLCSKGIVVSGGAGHQFNENYIYDNDVAGVWNETGSVVDATYNWWGDNSGPSGEGPGTGDAVSTNVDFDPWWLDDVYVDAVNGDDANNGNSWVTAKRTLQVGIDIAKPGAAGPPGNPRANYTIIHVADGSYAPSCVNKPYVALEAASSPIIDGGGTATAGLLIAADNVFIAGFTIRNCQNGVVVEGVSGADLGGNYIYDNSVYGLDNRGSEVVNATDNWWGYASGPYHPMSNPGGQGNRVSDNVLFDPWRTDPDIPGTTDRAYHDFPDTGWNLVSVPLDPMTPANGASVFDEVDNIGQRLYRYNGTTYDSGGLLPVKPEYGFWLYLSDPVVIDVAGTDVTPAAGDYYSTVVDFASGWQQIGVPFSTYWEYTKVTDGATERTLANAISGTPQWLGSNIYWWDAANQEYRWKGYDPSDPSELYMQPWDGYWIQNESGGNLGFKFLYQTPIPPCSAMAMKQAALWRPLSELEPGASRPPAPPMMPQAAAVAQNIAVMVAPNPVQQGTAVEFRVTGQMASFVSSVTVQVYTVGGQLVFDESSQGQAVTWNLTTLSGEPVANGLYLYVAQMEFVGGETAKFNKLLILK